MPYRRGRVFRAGSSPRWYRFVTAPVAAAILWADETRAVSARTLGEILISIPVLLVVHHFQYWRQATIVSWDGVTVRTSFTAHTYSWNVADWFVLRQKRAVGGRSANRAALQLTDGRVVPVTPRWGSRREARLVPELNAAAAWFRFPENRHAVEAWVRDHPPRFHPKIAGRPVGPLLVSVGMTSLALAAAFWFPVLHPHRKIDLNHQLVSTVPERLPHATVWICSSAIAGLALGLIALDRSTRNVEHISEPVLGDNSSRPDLQSSATPKRPALPAVVLAIAFVAVAAPVWFSVLVQALPPEFGALAVGLLAALGVFALGGAINLARRGHSRGRRFVLRGYAQWRHTLQ